MFIELEEDEGFEPSEVLPSLVFKTSAFDRSANLPVFGYFIWVTIPVNSVTIPNADRTSSPSISPRKLHLRLVSEN